MYNAQLGLHRTPKTTVLSSLMNTVFVSHSISNEPVNHGLVSFAGGMPEHIVYTDTIVNHTENNRLLYKHYFHSISFLVTPLVPSPPLLHILFSLVFYHPSLQLLSHAFCFAFTTSLCLFILHCHGNGLVMGGVYYIRNIHLII